MLTPGASSSREYLRLDGLWRFRFDTGEAGSGAGTAQRWWRAPLPGTREMPVPAVDEAAGDEAAGTRRPPAAPR